jgi:hypothetical protein
LNPNETDSQALLELLSKLENAALRGSHADHSDFDDLMEKAVARGQGILKTEWTRVKKGE